MNGKVMTSLDDLSKFLADGKFNEYVPGLTQNKELMGVLVMRMDDDKEEILTAKIESGSGASQCCCDPCDKCCCKEVERTIMIKSPAQP